MDVIAFVNSKGGVGKSTIAFNVLVQASLAKPSIRSALFDIDPQLSIADLRPNRDQAIACTKGRRTKREPTIEIVPLKDVESKMDQALRNGIELLVLDTPGDISEATTRAVRLADLVVCPIRGSLLDVNATDKIFGVLKDMQAVSKSLLLLNATRKDVNSNFHRGVDRALDVIGLEVAKTRIPDDVLFVTALNTGQGVSEIDGNSSASKAIKRLLGELLTRIEKSKDPRRRMRATF